MIHEQMSLECKGAKCNRMETNKYNKSPLSRGRVALVLWNKGSSELTLLQAGAALVLIHQPSLMLMICGREGLFHQYKDN
ncbi:hypothetical protein EJB05_51133, partial [Eragrostis curvula]